MKRILLIMVAIMLYAPMVFGLPGVKQHRLVWNANTESDLNGYYLYWRTSSGSFTNTNRMPLAKTATSQLLTGAVPNNTILALTAFDVSGNESALSIEVPFAVDGTAPSSPGGVAVQPVP